jgi:hypothetical protein
MSAERTATVAQTAGCCAPLGMSRAGHRGGDVGEEVTYRTKLGVRSRAKAAAVAVTASYAPVAVLSGVYDAPEAMSPT